MNTNRATGLEPDNTTPKLLNNKRSGRPRGAKNKNLKSPTKKPTRKPSTPQRLSKTPTSKANSTSPTPPKTPNQKPKPQNNTTPTTTNANNKAPTTAPQKKDNTTSTAQKVHQKIDQEATLKTSETPPEDKNTQQNAGSFQSVLIENIDTPMTDRLSKSTFLIQKELCEKKEIPDDESTLGNDNSTVSEYKSSVRTTMMYKLPPKTGDVNEEECPIFSIRKMNQMIKALTNKLACRLGPWKMKDAKTILKATDLLTELPEDIDFAETYVYDFNRFLSFEKNGYVRLHFYYAESTSLPEIEQVISQFKIPRVQFLEKAHSDALSPQTIGTLTGSVEAMASSRDFKDTFIHKFSLSTLGLWWGIPRQGKKAEYNGNKAVIHIEIDQKDFIKRKDIETFFNFTSSGIDNHFFGVPMLLTPPFHYFANDDAKANLELHSRKQVSLSKAISSTTISGIGLNNWANGEKTSTLLRELMSVESITKKQIVKGKKTSTFLGRLFYAIIPNRDTKSITFHFTKANASEGRGVARGLPHFIRDYFHLDPAFFCTSTALTEAMDGEWKLATRKFLSAQEKMEVDRLDDMEEEVNAVPVAFISKDHQQALAMDEDEVSVETRLTKGDAAPTPAILINDTVDEQSEMTGSTRESKAKKYADAAVKEVISEYSGTILNMSSDLEAKVDRIAQLELMLKNMNNTPMEGTEKHPIEMNTNNINKNADKSSETSNSNISNDTSAPLSIDNNGAALETGKKEVDLTSISAASTRRINREKRKLLEEEVSIDDNSRSTRHKPALNIDATSKTPSSDGANSL